MLRVQFWNDEAPPGASTVHSMLNVNKVRSRTDYVDEVYRVLLDAISDGSLAPGTRITQEELAERAKEKTPNALHVAVGNFLSTPKYDQVVARLKAAGETLPEADQVKKSEKTAAKANSLASIDFSKVKEVNFIRHDQHLGTVTMASSLFKDQMKKAGKTTPVKAVRINELDNDPSHLVIVTPMAGKNLAIRYDQIQVITVADLLKAGEVSGLVDKLK